MTGLSAIPDAREQAADEADHHDTVLVVDLGAQYAQLIARRVREAHVHSEIVPRTITAADLERRRPSAVILSGGPLSVYAENAYRIDRAGAVTPEDLRLVED